MNKIDLIFYPNSLIGFRSHYLEFLFKEYFNFCEYDSTKKYSTKNTVFVVNVIGDKIWVVPYMEQGYKIIVDNLWEAKIDEYPGTFHLVNKNWFWYNESLWYEQLGYSKYISNKTYCKLAFMPINRNDRIRDNIVDKLSIYLNQFIYSYKNIRLPNDADKLDLNWQRYFNSSWYNDTYFSLVIEASDKRKDFITEKTFKPIAFKHPFMIYSAPGSLQYIKSQGFETYENLFDESYDGVRGSDRLDKIITNIEKFIQEPYDKTTLEKIEHNHALFFNKKLVCKRIKEEIIEPLIEYAES